MKCVLLLIFLLLSGLHVPWPGLPVSHSLSVNTGIGPWSGAHHEPSVSHLMWWHPTLASHWSPGDHVTLTLASDWLTVTHMMTPDCLLRSDREEPGPGHLQSHYEQFWLWSRVSVVVNGYSPDFLEAGEDRRQHSNWDENQQEVHSVLPSLSGYGLILHI